MKYVYGSLLLLFLIFTVDLAHAHWVEYRRRKAATKWGMAPGAFKPVSKHWWAQ